MNTRILVLPAVSLAGAALLFSPLRSSQAFSKLGGSLGESQRDFRVFDNFADATADDNLTPASQFPGYTGLELAIWKGAVEWGSRPHGTGEGDILGNVLGSGGANFDAMWAGNTSAIGTTNGNIVSATSSCAGNTLAFTETPVSDGWRIRYCDNWAWDDGPASIGNRFDIQGVMTHEYGHALGLGHSGVSGATMSVSVGPGSLALRSIEADDIAGLQCIYNVAATKPTILATVADAGANTLTIHGTHFAPVGNEVWFTPAALTSSSAEPIVRVTGVSSSAGNTLITVSIPGAAGPGDVIVNTPGGTNNTVSNAFPTDLVGAFGDVPGPHPVITSVTPSTIAALIPGTAETITLTGIDLDLTTAVLLDGVVVSATRYTIVSASTITLDMPQTSSLGQHLLGVTDGIATDVFQVTIVTPATPTYQLGTGDAFNVVDRDNGLSYIISGPIGSAQSVVSSPSNLPSSNAFISLDLGDDFTKIYVGSTFVIPVSGWVEVVIPSTSLTDPGPAGKTFYSQTFDIAFPVPLDVSNLQSITLVR